MKILFKKFMKRQNNSDLSKYKYKEGILLISWMSNSKCEVFNHYNLQNNFFSSL